MPAELVKCDPDNSFVVCPERKEAMQRGEFLYDFARGGWIHVNGAGRTPLGDRGRYFNEGPLPPMLLEGCPWCGRALPLLSGSVQGDGPE